LIVFPQHDVDIMVKVENIMDVQVLRGRLSELDPRFVGAGMKLYVSQVRATTDSRDKLSPSHLC
jgi:hypothetical protein